MATADPQSINEISGGDLREDKAEWTESLDAIYREFGPAGAKEILRHLQNYALAKNIGLDEATLNTPYVNTIPPGDQSPYPGDIELEERIEKINRWNAIAMVLQAQDKGIGVGGHIATYASCATMLEVGFNHFFQGAGPDNDRGSADMFLPQPHAAPGIYARAYLEGRLTREQLANYRQELGEGGGLSSYPHPRSMPDFWEVPNASMGLSTPAAIYQARFAKYLENHGLKPAATGKVWCFIGDGESDEPEVLGTISMASREQLDNLMAFCHREDADSAQLLASYLEQRFPDEPGTNENAQHQDSGHSSGLTRAEALSVLGLADDATDEDIVSAHRTLIQKLHPDRGGNDYLAAKINEAKDFLLG